MFQSASSRNLAPSAGPDLSAPTAAVLLVSTTRRTVALHLTALSRTFLVPCAALAPPGLRCTSGCRLELRMPDCALTAGSTRVACGSSTAPRM